MAEYHAQVSWHRSPEESFTDKRYSRAHVWRFDEGIEVPASSSPHIVPLPFSREAAVDPEEAFVASLSSCHMLFFLSIAASKGHVIDFYEDKASGVMASDSEGKQAITLVTLRPRVGFSGVTPDAAEISALHHAAHEACFIANSVRSEIRCLPEFS